MTGESLLTSLASVLAAAAPILFAVMGETISERAGVLNLSMNGTILLSAMGSFAATLATGSLAIGFVAGAAIGAGVALVVAFAGISLKQSQVAVGFVLALLCRDLAYFLGNPVMGLPAPRLNTMPIPLLAGIPIIGPLFFRQDVMTYASFILIVAAWFFVFRTKQGLLLRGIGESPAAAYVRGTRVNRLRYLYTVAGGAIAGIAGPMYSLLRQGWLEGDRSRGSTASDGSRSPSRSSVDGTPLARRGGSITSSPSCNGLVSSSSRAFPPCLRRFSRSPPFPS